jgi:hypothetical protein
MAEFNLNVPKPAAGTNGAHRNAPRRAQFWSRLNEDWGRSGQTQAEFCRQRGVSLTVFRWWRYRRLQVQPQGLAARRISTPAFVPIRILHVKPKEPPSPVAGPSGSRKNRPGAAAALEIVLAGGRVLRVRDDFDGALMRKLLRILEGTATPSC